jgi:hypothetical protein
MRRELHSKFRAPFSSEDEHFRSHQAESALRGASGVDACVHLRAHRE